MDVQDAGPEVKPAKLHLYTDVDVANLGIKDLKEGNVGHTWIALEWNDPTAVPNDIAGKHKTELANGGKYADAMGFWPAVNEGIYYSTDLFDSYVKGWMRHPDRAHEGNEKASQTWDITADEAKAVIGYADGKKSAKYSVYFYNCTTFAKEAVKAAGKSPPSMGTMGVCYPNAVYNGIKKRQDNGQGNTMVEDMDSGVQSMHNGPDSKKGG